MLNIQGKTDVGLVRSTNQDCYDTGELRGGAAYAGVCDGMGGVSGGNVASECAVASIREDIRAAYSEQLGTEELRGLLIDAFSMANRKVYAMAAGNPLLSGMGTTVVAAVVRGDEAVVVSAGDSRAYVLEPEGGIRQITRDHSMVQEMIESGRLTPTEAASHPHKNIITRALGVEQRLEIDAFEVPFPEGAALLLCTDGLSNVVEPALLESVTRDGGDEAAGRLIALANRGGGGDNSTVVIVRHTR